jgi:alkylation response protein AidB-like acyl-CoA dehydrogenase
MATDGGDHFKVSGTKKWITNGIYADYFTVLCRTGKGAAGLSMLLVEKKMDGINTQKMPGMGVWPSGTTYIEFRDVKVPKANVIGVVGAGFKQTMFNFNHERWLLCAQAWRMMSTCVSESLTWAQTRRTFGKTLAEHQVIQHKFAEMIRVTEATYANLETITAMMKAMSREEQNAKLGGHIALLKVQSTKSLEFCAREAMQVLGGTGYSRGVCTSVQFGEKVERIYREVRAMAIPGGSEEIMLNLAVGQLGLVPAPKKKSPKAQLKEMEKMKAALEKKIEAAKAKL